MVKARIFQLDAFTKRRFTGNPAAVMPLDHFPPDDVLLALAAENNLSETAFLVGGNGEYQLRWFTPRVEVALCGHATLASAAVVLERLEPSKTEVVFHTQSGTLVVKKTGDDYAMDLPLRICEPRSDDGSLALALGITPLEVWTFAGEYLAVLPDEASVRGCSPDYDRVAALDCDGVVITAPADSAQGGGAYAEGYAKNYAKNYDCVSRYFAPKIGVPEDPVTGSIHCALVPFWAERLSKPSIRAYQASKRGGDMVGQVIRAASRGQDRVEIRGSIVFFFEGVAEF